MNYRGGTGGKKGKGNTFNSAAFSKVKLKIKKKTKQYKGI